MTADHASEARDRLTLSEIRARLELVLPDDALLGLGSGGALVIHLLGDASAADLAARLTEGAAAVETVKSLKAAIRKHHIDGGISGAALGDLLAAFDGVPATIFTPPQPDPCDRPLRPGEGPYACHDPGLGTGVAHFAPCPLAAQAWEREPTHGVHPAAATLNTPPHHRPGGP